MQPVYRVAQLAGTLNGNGKCLGEGIFSNQIYRSGYSDGNIREYSVECTGEMFGKANCPSDVRENVQGSNCPWECLRELSWRNIERCPGKCSGE